MYLSRLDIHGFKSFAMPTALRFDPGITAIVGPNGCGKSNVVDALRWVIGEQRPRVLRSDKMDSVIFNGTARRRGLGMAEVQLTIQNTRALLPTEYSEVTLGRRLYRSGDSEYLLNGTLCRLRDIVELFLDTGMGSGAYSVIELKMIGDILSDVAHDRRRLFEEAASITRYKQRRSQALRKLENVQADLLRVQDLTAEVAARAKRLNRQAKTAARHDTLTTRARALSLALSTLEYNKLDFEVSVLDEALNTLRERLARIKAETGSQDARLMERRKGYMDLEEAAKRSRNALRDHERRVDSLMAEIRLKREQQAATRREVARVHRRREETLARQARREESLSTLCEDRSRTEPELAGAAHSLKRAMEARDAARKAVKAERTLLDDLSRQHGQLIAAQAAQLRLCDRITAALEHNAAQTARLKSKAQVLAARSAEEKVRVRKALEAHEEATEVLNTAREEAARAEAEHSLIEQQIATADAALRALAQREAAMKAEATLFRALVEGYEDFPVATKFLAQALGKIRTISDLLTSDPEYRAAIAAALGPLGACIVVQTVEEAAQAAALLKTEDKGRALLVVMDRLPRTVPRPPPHPGFIPLMDLVQVHDPAYATLVRLVLGDTYYVDQLDWACPLVAPPWRLVSASGEWLDASGFVQVGSEAQETSFVHMDRAARLAAAEASLNGLQAEHQQQQAALKVLRSSQRAVGLEAKRSALLEAKQALADAHHAYDRVQQERASAVDRQARLRARLKTLAEEAQSLANQASEPQAAAQEEARRLASLKTRMSVSQRALMTAEAEVNQRQDRYLSARLADQRARSAWEHLGRDISRIEGEAKRAAERAEALEEESAALEAQRASLDRAIAALQDDLAAERARSRRLEEADRQGRTRLMETRVAMDELEKALRRLHRTHEEAMVEERTLSVERVAHATRMADIATAAQEAYGAVISDDLLLPNEEAAMRTELETIQASLRSIGTVNALALQEYEKERERHAFMMEHCEDLRKAEATLLQTADEINRTAAKRFIETFQVIRENFCKLYRDLFDGNTSADLRLVDPGDPLESPIAITARPRGKRPISIAQLSSGEQTLTAIALLFAIYQVKPSPFCFLDEVDAPLDDANIERFMRLIRRFSLDTQFVLVTHNQRTMEMADRLYGITMQEEGVSRVVGVEFEEALAMAA